MDLNKLRELAGIPAIGDENLSPLSEMNPLGEQPAEAVIVISNEVIEEDDTVTDEKPTWFKQSGTLDNEDEKEDEEVDEAFDLNNGYGDEQKVEELGDYGDDYFPDGQTSTAPKRLGPSSAKSGNNPMSAKQFTESSSDIHKTLVYKYRNFKKNNL